MAPSAARPAASTVATTLTEDILRELVHDIAIEEHRLAQLRRSRLSQSSAQSTAGTANGTLEGVNGVNGAAPSVSPTKKDKDEGLYECIVCGRSIAAPRYAAHLAQCMGLSGSRRGGSRAATNGKTGANGLSRAGSTAGSDTDTGSKANGIKRAATASPVGNAAPKPKKPKAAPIAGAPLQMQPPHVGSHPLAKTMSLPSSPVLPIHASALPAISGRPVPPPPPPLDASAPPSSAQMQARNSLPGSAPLPPNPALATAKRPPHPLAQSPARPPLVAAQMASDRPDSDSESDSDLDAKPAAPPVARGTSQKMPRPGVGAPQSQTIAPQKTPRKAAPVAKKAGRIARAAGVDYGSDSDDDASDGSGSD
ncbi:hypothetical protein JCM10207_004524 [Rhodosporidiobolus poonsookiae]